VRVMAHCHVSKSLLPYCPFLNYSAPVGVPDIVINPSVCVCVCVCLTASISLEPLDRSSRIFVQIPVAVAWSSSGGVAIRYVLPVLWMTSHVAVWRNMEAAPP